VPQEYLATLAQRNAALRRVQLGLANRDAVGPWTERIASLAAALVEERRSTLESLAPGFAARASELGVPDARLGYDAEAPTADELEARLGRDVERGATGLGPHLDDVLIASGDRDLRQFGSQGEQRLVVLALLLGQLQMLVDCCDGEVARWRKESSPAGVFLDKVGHYSTEALIPIALGIRAAAYPFEAPADFLWTSLALLLGAHHRAEQGAQ